MMVYFVHYKIADNKSCYQLTGTTNDMATALSEMNNTSTDINGNPSINTAVVNEQSKQQENNNRCQPMQESNIQIQHDTTDKVDDPSKHSLNNDFSNDMRYANKNLVCETIKTDNIGRNRNSSEMPHLRNNHNNSVNNSGSGTNKRRMANTSKYCHGCNDLHGQRNGLSSRKRRRGPKFTSTYYLASSKKSAAASNGTTMTNSKMPGRTVDDICNKLHAVAHTKRKNTNDHHCGAEKKIKGMKIVNSDNSKTTVKYDPSCRTFQVGDIVWGKVQGHPWWPGRIVSLDATIEEQQLYPCKAVVAWYNSNTCSIITARRLYKFDESYDLRHTPKKRGAYQKAVEDALLASRQQQSYDVIAN